MTIKIPPSINWLIKKYARKLDEMRHVESERECVLKKYLAIKADLEALEKVIGLHEIPITASDISALRRNRNVTQLKHGELTRLIFDCLKIAAITKREVTTTDVFKHIVRLKRLEFETSKDRNAYRQAVRKRLKDLALQGRIIRKPGPDVNSEAAWEL